MKKRDTPAISRLMSHLDTKVFAIGLGGLLVVVPLESDDSDDDDSDHEDWTALNEELDDDMVPAAPPTRLRRVHRRSIAACSAILRRERAEAITQRLTTIALNNMGDTYTQEPDEASTPSTRAYESPSEPFPDFVPLSESQLESISVALSHTRLPSSTAEHQLPAVPEVPAPEPAAAAHPGEPEIPLAAPSIPVQASRRTRHNVVQTPIAGASNDASDADVQPARGSKGKGKPKPKGRSDTANARKDTKNVSRGKKPAVTAAVEQTEEDETPVQAPPRRRSSRNKQK